MRWIKRFLSKEFWEDVSESDMRKRQGFGLSIITAIIYGVSFFVVPWAQNHPMEWSLIWGGPYLFALLVLLYG
ncbi:hypothetical protein HER14_07815 [Acidithiobacillus thiooxidans]|uniref:hypothetical protein n=1 Tax=Acidithiobacillus thiooxidans TaxID=930 RepID=UPI001C07D9BB|nr:hypothetical protein [Acidithiobacillus thiooxidans]MBU2750849.1 hypothetical protein [Acidithiobacillus thiooxidans]